MISEPPELDWSSFMLFAVGTILMIVALLFGDGSGP